MKNTSRKNEKLLWTGSWTSQIGNIIFDYANSLFIIGTGTGASFLLALYQSADTLMGVFFNMLGGAFADRHSRKKICITTDVLSAVACLLLAFVLQSEAAGLFMVIANVLLAVFHAFNSPTYMAMIREMIEKDRIQRFNAIGHGVKEVIRVASPVAGLLLVGRIGVRGALIADAATFLFSAFLETMLAPLPGYEEKQKTQKVSLLSDIREGWHYMVRERVIFFLVCLSALVNFFLAGYNLLLPFSEHFFAQWGNGFYSKAMVAEAAGGILGAFLGAKLKDKAESLLTMILYLGLTGFFLFMIPFGALFTVWVPCLIFYALFAASLALFNIKFNSFVQINVDKDYLGRVFSIIYTIAVLFMPLGSVVFSAVLGTQTPYGYYVIGTGIVLLALAGALVRNIFFRRAKGGQY